MTLFDVKFSVYCISTKQYISTRATVEGVDLLEAVNIIIRHYRDMKDHRLHAIESMTKRKS